MLTRYMPPLPLGLLVLEKYKTFTAFAKVAGVSRQAISKYFSPNPKNWTNPQLHQAKRMAEALGMTLDEFSERLERERQEQLRKLKEVQSA